MKPFSLFLLTLLLSWVASALPAQPRRPLVSRKGSPVARSAFPIVGYLPDYRLAAYTPAKEQSPTDLIYFSLLLQPNGELDKTHLPTETLEQLRALKKRLKVRILVAVGGWERSAGFASVSADTASRKRFIQACLELCRANDLDGIDLDWEHPKNATEEAAYGTLIQECKQAFRPAKLLVTAAIAGWQNLPREAFQALDRVHLMAYDHEGRHSTYEQAVQDVEGLLRRGAVASKLFLGLPFYGRGVTDRREMTYAEIVAQHRPAPEVDEVAGTYFNGPTTIQKKVGYAREKGLGGVMIWEVGQDTQDTTSLLQAIQKALGWRR